MTGLVSFPRERRVRRLPLCQCGHQEAEHGSDGLAGSRRDGIGPCRFCGRGGCAAYAHDASRSIALFEYGSPTSDRFYDELYRGES